MNPWRIALAVGAAAVQAAHTCCTEGEFFSDTCEECVEVDENEDGSETRRCHLGPKWIPYRSRDYVTDEEEQLELLEEEPDENDPLWKDTYLYPLMQVPYIAEKKDEKEFLDLVCEGATDVIEQKAHAFLRWTRMVVRRDATADCSAWVCCEFARERDVPF